MCFRLLVSCRGGVDLSFAQVHSWGISRNGFAAQFVDESLQQTSPLKLWSVQRKQIPTCFFFQFHWDCVPSPPGCKDDRFFLEMLKKHHGICCAVRELCDRFPKKRYCNTCNLQVVGYFYPDFNVHLVQDSLYRSLERHVTSIPQNSPDFPKIVGGALPATLPSSLPSSLRQRKNRPHVGGNNQLTNFRRIVQRWWCRCAFKIGMLIPRDVRKSPVGLRSSESREKVMWKQLLQNKVVDHCPERSEKKHAACGVE